MGAMRIRTALLAVMLLTPLLLTGCGEGQSAEPTPTPTPAVKPIPWEFPLWSEVLREIEDCIPPDERITISDIWQDDSIIHVGGHTSAVICAYDYAENLDEAAILHWFILAAVKGMMRFQGIHSR